MIYEMFIHDLRTNMSSAMESTELYSTVNIVRYCVYKNVHTYFTYSE